MIKTGEINKTTPKESTSVSGSTSVKIDQREAHLTKRAADKAKQSLNNKK